jgi:phosphatidylglycerol---prolipoprotein diacylglyceryl transferase
LRPVLFSLALGGQPYVVHTYGIAIAVGFVVAILVGVRTARKMGEDAERVRDLCFWLLVSSLVGARLLFIVTMLPQYVDACRVAHDCFAIFRVWQGGLVFFGGFFGALLAAVWYTRRHNMGFFRVADILSPSVALGHFFGRLGCFAAGCCWGKPADVPWAVRFPSESLAYQDAVARGALPPSAEMTMPLHPTQLYEAFGELAIFFALSLLLRRKRWDGQILVAWLVAYSILRFTVEMFRGDAVRGFLFGVSTSQLIALLTLPLAAAIWLARRSTSRGRSTF